MEKLSLDYLGIIHPINVYHQLSPAQLTEKALAAGEGVLTDTGALRVMTGKYTGRSPKDRFIVDEPEFHDQIAWGKVNMPISNEKFERIYKGVRAYLQHRDIYVFDGFAGADPD